MFSLWSNIWSQRGITRKDTLHINIAHQTSASKCLSIKSQFCLRKDKRLHSKCFSLLTRHSNRLVVVSSHQREQQLKWWRSRKIRIGGKQTHFSLNKTSIQSFLSLARKIKKVKNGILQTWYYALQLSLGEVCMECMVMILCIKGFCTLLLSNICPPPSKEWFPHCALYCLPSKEGKLD